MAQKRRAQRLNGLFPLSYLGVVPVSPVNFVVERRAPTQNDLKNFYVGDLWLDISSTPGTAPDNEDVWMLVDVEQNVATWVNFGGGDMETLSGDSGTNPVTIDANDNINVFGDNAIGLTSVGDGVNTLTITTTDGNPLLRSLTGNDAVIVVADAAGNIDVLGDTLVGLTTVNTGANEITVTTDDGNVIARSLTGDDAVVVLADAAGNIDVITDNANIGAGASVLFTGGVNELVLEVTDDDGNTFIGLDSGNLTTTTIQSTALGEGALENITSGNSNTAIGWMAGNALTTADNNTFLGVNAGSNISTKDNNILIAHPGVNAAVSSNVCIGSPGTTSNTFLHNVSLTGGQPNLGIGTDSVGSFTAFVNTGSNNVGLGQSTMRDMTTALRNSVVGQFSLTYLTTGEENCVLGYSAAADPIADAGMTTGSRNVLIGNNIGDAFRAAESDNILINCTGQAALGENNTTRIGAGTGTGSYQQNRVFFSGIRGITTAVADAVAVLVDSADQLGTVSSSIRYKENIESMGETTNALYDLRPVNFDYKEQKSHRRQYGLIAEEVDLHMPDLVVYDKEGFPESIRYHELPVMLLNEMKKLRERIEQLEAKL